MVGGAPLSAASSVLPALSRLPLLVLHSRGAEASAFSFSTVPLSLVLGLAVLLCLFPCEAQEAVRLSMASADAAAARRQAASTLGYYNLKMGQTGWRFGTGLGVEYNDNVRYTEDKEGDFILRPNITASMLWPVTDQNSLNLDLGVGYWAYLKNPDLSRWDISPNSELSFDLYAKDVWINFHDRFALTQDSYQDPTVYGTGDYSRFENTLGVSALWDLNKVIVRTGYDHMNYLTVSGGPNQPDGQYEIVSLAAGYAVRPQMLVGVETGGGYIRYSGGTRFLTARCSITSAPISTAPSASISKSTLARVTLPPTRIPSKGMWRRINSRASTAMFSSAIA